MRHLRTCFAALMIGIVLACSASVFAVQVHKNMLDSRLAEVELNSKLDLKAIQDLGGIVDNFNGTLARVYLLPEDFRELQLRGMTLRWLTEEEIDPYGDFRHPHETLDEYHYNDDIEAMFIGWQASYPTMFSYESIGLSVENRNLWMAKLSDNVTSDEPEIEVKYISTMHGDEVVGLENCLRFIDTLLTGYGTDPELTELMDDFEIFIMPLMNPDGREVPQRYNADGADLNRTFPDRIVDSVNTPVGHPQEVGLVMNWSATRNCVLSANFHGGEVIANYPWDNNYSGLSIHSPTPEHDLFYHLAYTYASYNSSMLSNHSSPSFINGTTNGADWYVISGGMQDWNYVWMGCKEITMELSYTKSGPLSALDSLWWENETSMRKYLLEAREGVRGFVTDASTGDPVRADIMLDAISYVTYSSALHGDYHRIFRPGTYTLTFSAPGYESQTINNISVVAGTPTILNVQLNRTPAPEIAVSPLSIEEPIPVCDEIEVPIMIENNGTTSLSWSGILSDWTVIDSRESSLEYVWRDISSEGTEIDFSTDDQNLGPYSIGFTFPFYGQNFTTYRISANGWLSFTATDAGESSYNNTGLPNSSAPENLIAPWWDDLSPHRTGCVVTRYTSGTDSLIISYENVESYQYEGLYNFQMILLASGDILFQYGDMGANRLTSATIGLQNSTGSAGLQIARDETFIENNMALRICSGSVVDLVPVSGSIPASGSDVVSAVFNSCCLPEGLYTTSIEISSNDPFHPLVSIPVTLDVGGQMDPDPVTDLTALFEDGGVRLNWSESADATSYEIWRGITPDFDTSSGSMLIEVTETTYLDNSAIGEILFYFVIAKR
ncbi:hypothetical protein EH220_01865 [bacterium]|nr:MAG: hypothetical protein EH220_01865 [bacterium]